MFCAVANNVSSGSARREGRKMIAAGFPPVTLSVNAFRIVKGKLRFFAIAVMGYEIVVKESLQTPYIQIG
jgi:hypothetical protein